MIKFNSYCNKTLDLEFGRLVSTEELISRFDSGEKLEYKYAFYVYKYVDSDKIILGYFRNYKFYDCRRTIELDTRKGNFLRVVAFLDSHKEEFMKNHRSIPNTTAKELVTNGVLKIVKSMYYTEVYE